MKGVIPRYRSFSGWALFSAGFRPFFLGAAIWAAVVMPLWLAIYTGRWAVPSAYLPVTWHAHEMIYGYGASVVAGFLLTAIPNWTGRMPLQGWPLVLLFATWIGGRVAMLLSAAVGGVASAIIDMAFPVIFVIVIAREILTGRNWHNLAVVAGLLFFGFGNFLVHLEVLEIIPSENLGNRLGLAVLLMLISLIGGRIIPSFTTNWMKKNNINLPLPPPKGVFDNIVLVVVALTLLRWVFIPTGLLTATMSLAGGVAVTLRLSRWRGLYTIREPLLAILHVGYGWLGVGLSLLGLNGIFAFLPPATVLHTLSIGAVGTMTLGVMSRASLGHTGRPLTAGVGTVAIYILVSVAAILRIIVSLNATNFEVVMILAGLSWSAAFGLFAVLYGKLLVQPRM